MQPLYDGLGNRVAQVTDGVTTTFALDVMGLPEVIYTSDDTKYLHLPGLIMTENTTGTQRFLLSDNLGVEFIYAIKKAFYHKYFDFTLMYWFWGLYL